MTNTKPLSMGLLLNWLLPNVAAEDAFGYLCGLCRAAEEAGFDSVWVPDHFSQVYPGGRTDEPVLEAYTVLGGLAARTSRLRLGTLVSAVTHRNPAVLAKQVTTLDVMSGGRAVLGIGAGWNAGEHHAYGLPFSGAGGRFQQLSDTVQICRSMFRNPSTTFTGQQVSVIDAMNVPQPIAPTGPPIMVGGSGERRTLRIVAEHANISNTAGPPQTQRRLMDVLDRHCEGVGRDPASITRTSLRPVILGSNTAQVSSALSAAEQLRFAELSPIAGNADAVLEGVGEYLDAGLDGIIVFLPQAHRTREQVMAVGAVLGPLLNSVAAPSARGTI